MVVVIFLVVACVAFTLYALYNMQKMDDRIDDIFNKILCMQGEIESNTARAKDNYLLIAKLADAIDKIDKDEEPIEETTRKENDSESIVSYELSVRRQQYATYRKQGMDVKSAGVAVGVSYSTAKRYEQWRKNNKK